MNPTLVSILGPLQGSTFHCDKSEFSIGRDSSNSLCVPDSLISRKHCLIIKDEDKFRIKDLDSRHGIFVNGVPTKERFLDHGDQIEIGNSLFLFIVSVEEVLEDERDQIDRQNLANYSTTRLRMKDALYLNSIDVITPSITARMAHDFSVLLQINREINSIHGVDAVSKKLFDFIFQVVPAECAAILIFQGGSTEISSVHKSYRDSRATQDIRISRTIIDQVFDEGLAILSNRISQDERFDNVQSLAEAQVESLVCVPLTLSDKRFGALYVDTTKSGIVFDEGHLQLLAAIGSLGAVALDHEQQLDWLVEENRRLTHDSSIHHDMIGESPEMKQIYQSIARVAPSNATVLIGGESGTGKELVARAIHLNSGRGGKPFVAINSAALAETLLESELFGHEKGAFTGAIYQKKGKLEIAEGGSVFLDEIAELSLVLQTKLLRVIQERQFERLGGTRTIHVNIRWIVATNKVLEELVKAGKFREDLFFRINVVSINLPPLRDRSEDIPLLASYFAAKYGKESGKKIKGISNEARQCLLRYDWPGNVRELQNAIECAVVLSSTEILQLEDLPEHVLEGQAYSSAVLPRYHETIREAKRDVVRNALKQAEGDIKSTAEILGVHPNYLYRLIRKLNL